MTRAMRIAVLATVIAAIAAAVALAQNPSASIESSPGEAPKPSNRQVDASIARRLKAVMAHEVAHADLGHVAKAQRLGTGLTIGMVLLDQILPGSRALTPIAGQLIQSSYGRKEEYQADAHGVEILDRAGFDGRSLMANTLMWLTEVESTGGGGFFATHPATGDRISAVRRLPDHR
jgi:Zn-dependent protease with chaperone function